MDYVSGPRRTKEWWSLTDPQDYLEHGRIIRPYDRVPLWLRRTRRGPSRPRRLTREEMMRVGFVQSLIAQMAMDVFSQQFFGTFNARYLTNKPGEAQLPLADAAKGLSRLSSRTATVCAELTHSIPLFMEVHSGAIDLEFAKRSLDAFVSYRAALGKIAYRARRTRKSSLRQSQARQLYLDVLEPELLNLQQKAKNEQQQQINEVGLRHRNYSGSSWHRTLQRSSSRPAFTACYRRGGRQDGDGFGSDVGFFSEKPTRKCATVICTSLSGSSENVNPADRSTSPAGHRGERNRGDRRIAGTEAKTESEAMPWV